MAGEGALLRNARKKKGWSLHEAEEITKIRVRYLEAIEEENYTILPGSVYVKGFLRNYAKHLDVNADEIIAMYQESSSQEVKQVLPQRHTTPKQKPKWTKSLVIGILSLIFVITAIGLITANIPEQQPPASGYTPTPLPNAPENKSPIEPPQANKPEPSAPQVSTIEVPPQPEGLQVELAFDENCWISYKVDNGPVVEKTFLVGDVEIIQAKEKFTFVTIGNAGGLNLTVNGQKLNKLGKSKEVVRNYIITKDNIR